MSRKARQADFRGTALRFDDAINEWRASIDGGPPVTIDRPGKTDATIDGLSPGAHHIRLGRVVDQAGLVAEARPAHVVGDGGVRG